MEEKKEKNNPILFYLVFPFFGGSLGQHREFVVAHFILIASCWFFFFLFFFFSWGFIFFLLNMTFEVYYKTIEITRL